jgi:hypothetical protein
MVSVRKGGCKAKAIEPLSIPVGTGVQSKAIEGAKSSLISEQIRIKKHLQKLKRYDTIENSLN